MAAKGTGALKVILVIYGLLFLILWGLMPVFGDHIAALIGLKYTIKPIFGMDVGWLGMIIGLLLLFASRDPVKNVLVINIMIIANILFIIFYFVEWLVIKERMEFIWLPNLIAGIVFLILMIIFRPKKA